MTGRFHATADRLLVVLSDIEMGPGGPMDDFAHDGWLADVLERYNRAPYRDVPVDFVFNGDTFDFLKTPGLTAHPHHVTDQVALGKLRAIAAAHPRFFDTLGRLVVNPSLDRRVLLITGNHDLALAFEPVQRQIRRLAGLAEDDPRISYPGFEHRVGDVHIEHGSQSDPLFRVDPDRLWVQHGGRTLLAHPWGAVALLATAIKAGKDFGHLDRVKPRERVFDVMPEAKELLLKWMWEYWTRDFMRDLVDGGDPLKTVSWPMFREILYRFGSGDSGVNNSARAFEERLHRDDGPRLGVFGHLHSAEWRSFAGGKILVTGALRDEFAINAAGETVEVLPKTWAEVWMEGDRVVRSELVEEFGPAPNDVPATVLEFKDRIVELLGPDGERKASLAARLKHEAEARRPNFLKGKGRRTG